MLDRSFSFARDLDKIAAEEELDGLYIVRSNVEAQLFDAEQTVTAYRTWPRWSARSAA